MYLTRKNQAVTLTSTGESFQLMAMTTHYEPAMWPQDKGKLIVIELTGATRKDIMKGEGDHRRRRVCGFLSWKQALGITENILCLNWDNKGGLK